MDIAFENGKKLEYSPKIATVLEWLLDRVKISPTNNPPKDTLFEYTLRFDQYDHPEGIDTNELALILDKLNQFPTVFFSERTDELTVEIYSLDQFEALVKQYLKLKDKGVSEQTIVRHYIPKLFELTPPPRTSITYKGKNRKNGDEPQRTHGRTQTYAILSLLAEVYEKKKANGNIYNNEIQLSLKEIYEIINDPAKCNKPPDWKFPDDLGKQKSRLNDLKDNIRKIAPFTDEELDIGVNSMHTVAYLVFRIPS